MAWCVCENPGYNQFFGTFAGACVYTPAQMLPQILGFCSLLTWICAGLPQYISTYRTKQAEALAPMLFIIRGLGDICMLIGTILEGATIPLQAVSAFFILDDIIMLSQLYYYTYIYQKNKLPTTIPMSTAGRTKQTAAMFAIAFISTGVLTANTLLVSSSQSSSRSLLQEQAVRMCDDFGRSETEKAIGGWLIWAGGAIYFLSRIPQVYKNWQNRQCEGLSTGMFLMFAIANITYGGQVILQAILDNMDAKTFMTTKFNFVIGSCGVLLFDVIIIIQSKLYNQSKK